MQRDESVSRPLALFQSVVDASTSWFALTMAIAIAPGIAVWPLAHHHQLGRFMRNELDTELRYELLATLGLSAALVLAFYGVVHFWSRRKDRSQSFGDTCRALNRYTFVVLAFPLLTGVAHLGMETEHPFITLSFIGLITALSGAFIYRMLELRPVPRRRTATWREWTIVALAGCFYGGFLSYLAVLDHYNLGTHLYDLGIYDNLFWHTSQGDFLGCSFCLKGTHLTAHFDPIIWVFSPIYRLIPRAETLLVLQSVWLATGVVPLFLLGCRRLEDTRLAALLCVAYALYPPLHGANMFDFHSLTMVVPTSIWLAYFIDSGARVPLWIALALMLMTREDMPLLACFFGAYACLQRRPLTGVAMVVVSLTYLAVVKLYVMPDPGLLMSGKGTASYAYFFEEMIPNPDEGVRGFVISLVTNPMYALKVFLTEGRVFFFLVLLGPLLFLPLLGGKKRFIMIYGFIFLGLASRKYVYDLHFQYSSVLFPVLLAAVPDGVVRASRSRLLVGFGLDRRYVAATIVWMVVICTGLTSVKYGAIVPNEHFKAGWNRLTRTPQRERNAYLKELLEKIPADAAVCATSSLGPHVTNRELAFKWPSCADSEWALLHSPRFKDKDKQRLKRHVRSGRFELVAGGEHDIELYRIHVTEAERRAAEERRRRDAEELRGKPAAGSVGPKEDEGE